MSITIELEPAVEAALQSEAAKNGLTPDEFATQLITREVPRRVLTSVELLALPRQQRREYLRAAADAAEGLYDADLAIPVVDREVTAFTVLDGEPVHEYGS